MNDLSQLTLNELIAEVQELEEAYANELADGANRKSLNLIHDRIKQLNREISIRQEQNNRQN
jgi:hypothetical protein